MFNDIERIFFSEEEIKAKVKELGQQISKDFAGKHPLVVGVLKGSFIFMADLIRNIDVYCDVEFIHNEYPFGNVIESFFHYTSYAGICKEKSSCRLHFK